MSTRSRLLSIAVLISATALVGCFRSAEKSPETSAGQPASDPKKGGYTSVLVVIDKTGSADGRTLEQFAPEIEKALTSCEVCQSVTILNVGAMGEATVWKTPAETFTLPLKPSGVFDEATAQAKAKKHCGGRLACEKRLIQEARDQFQANAADALTTYDREHSKAVSGAIATMLRRPQKEPAFTDLAEVADRIALTPSECAIWLTDGNHNAPTPLRARTFPNKVLLALTPLANEQHQGFMKRLNALSKMYAAPTVTVKPVAALNSASLIAFLNGS